MKKGKFVIISGPSGVGKDTICDELVKKGGLAKDALEKVAKAMSFDSTKGINDAVTSLNLLREQGKITSEEMQARLVAALDGKDLLVFQTNAKAAFAGTAQEAAKSAAVTEAVMKAALGRTGLETQQLKGSFSSTFQSASNDVQIVIDNLLIVQYTEHIFYI